MDGCRPLDEKEVERIARHLGKRDKAWFFVGIATGLRVSEVLSLRRADLRARGKDFDRRIFIDKSRLKGKKRGRVVFLDLRAKRALSAWLKINRGPLLFPSPFDSSKPISRGTAHAIIRGAAEKARVKMAGVGTHSMRKTFALRAYVKLQELAKVALIIGHQDIRSTARYVPGCSERELWDTVNGALVAGFIRC